MTSLYATFSVAAIMVLIGGLAAARQPLEQHADSGQVRYISARAVSFAGTTICGDQFRV
jgi:hypothetical protein